MSPPAPRFGGASRRRMARVFADCKRWTADVHVRLRMAHQREQHEQLELVLEVHREDHLRENDMSTALHVTA